MALLSRCRKTGSTPQLLARNLLIGLDDRELVQAGPIAVGPAEGWSQTVAATREGAPVQLRSVTLKSGSCIFDWILVTSGPKACE